MNDKIPTRSSTLATATLQTTAGLTARTLLQAIVFVSVARLLGVEGFGAFAALLALAGSIGQLGGMGCQTVMIRTVARNTQTFGESWEITLAITALSAPILLLFYALLANWLSPAGIQWMPILLIGMAEIVFAPPIVAAISAFQAHGMMSAASRLIAAPAVARFISLAALLPLASVLTHDELFKAWSAIYACGAVGTMLYALRNVRMQLNPAALNREWQWRELRSTAKSGFPFAIGGLGLRVYADIDKTMLGRMDTLHATGSYAAAYRIAEFIILPVHSLFIAALPHMFRISAQGPEALARYMKALWLMPLAYTVTAAIVVWAVAPWLPLLLGDSFHSAVEPLRWLAWLPIVTLPRLHWQQRLVGMERHTSAVSIIAAGALLNILLNLWLIPLASWKGAVISTYIAEGIMASIMFFLGSYIFRARSEKDVRNEVC